MGFSPVVIGGVGGSGTRVIAETLQKSGFYLGTDLNTASDNLWFTLLFKRASLLPLEDNKPDLDRSFDLFMNAMIERRALDQTDLDYLQALATETRLEHPVEWRQARVDSLRAVIAEAAAGTRLELWGWKEPNSHHFVPYLNARLPGLRYIHVVRHGLDMAFSANQNQLEFWGKQILGRTVDRSSPADSLAYWCRVHQIVGTYAEKLGDRFLLLNFDEFCASPDTQLPVLLDFLGLEGIDPERLVSTISEPGSKGRYHEHDLGIFQAEDLAFVQAMGFTID